MGTTDEGWHQPRSAAEESVQPGRDAPADDFVGRLLAIGRDFRAHLKPGYRDVDVDIIDTMLYDERGLPK